MSKQKSGTLLRSSSEMLRRTLCGIIECSTKHCNLDPDDVIVVTLYDTTLLETSRFDFPHIPQRYIVSTVKLDGFDDLPVPFTLYYNEEEIDSNLCYGVRCDILNKSQEIKYHSEHYVPVLTDKNPKTNIHVIVSPRND